MPLEIGAGPPAKPRGARNGAGRYKPVAPALRARTPNFAGRTMARNTYYVKYGHKLMISLAIAEKARSGCAIGA
jgi:hypothetical protein